MKAAMIVGAMCLVTYLCRAVPLLSFANPAKLPDWLKRRLEYVPPTILAAMVAPAILIRDGRPAIHPELLAYGLCLAVALKTRTLFLPLLAGLAALLGLHLFLGR